MLYAIVEYQNNEISNVFYFCSEKCMEEYIHGNFKIYQASDVLHLAKTMYNKIRIQVSDDTWIEPVIDPADLIQEDMVIECPSCGGFVTNGVVYTDHAINSLLDDEYWKCDTDINRIKKFIEKVRYDYDLTAIEEKLRMLENEK